MALLQISEPGQSPDPHERKRAVGIDLGTTNSLVATVIDGQGTTLPDESGDVLLPSVVRYTEFDFIVGQAAKDEAAKDPLNTLMSIKRLMGRGREEIFSDSTFAYRFAQGDSSVPVIETAAGLKTPIRVSADILSVLAQRGREALGGELEGVVITVPAYFDDAQRQATKDAARLAGLPLMRLLNEPTAAAVAYGLDQQEDGVIAVYDLGGGTFDISILRLTKGVFEVMATGGDTALGGDDFDQAIMRWMITKLGLDPEISPEQQRECLTLARQLKEQLSDHEAAVVEYQGQQCTLEREHLNTLIDPLIQRSLLSCKRSLRDAGLSQSDIGEVIMVGGSTRIPRVREKVAELFEREPLVSIDPDQVVAVGAALQADVLVGNKSDNDMLLLDVVPLSLGLETMGSLVEKIIPRNTTIPIAKAQEFTTFKDGQTAMSIHVLQGERELVKNCRSLAHFELRGIPPMVAGAAHIRVTFQVDADGLLSVSAEETSTGVCAEVTVKPSYGLGDEDITQMIRDSLDNADEDIRARSLREQQVEAERLLEALSTALMEDGHRLLTASEYRDLETALDKLKIVHNGDDPDAIQREVNSVSQMSESFAAKRMNSNIKLALAGHNVEEFDCSSKTEAVLSETIDLQSR